jgi:hypothetical protein
VLVCCALLAGKGTMAQTALPSLSDPAISPDGREIAWPRNKKDRKVPGGYHRGWS